MIGNRYQNKIRALKKPDKVQLKREMVENVKNNFVGTLTQIEQRIKQVEIEADKTYTALLGEYNAKHHLIIQDFKTELFASNGVADNPKAEKAYEYVVREFDAKNLETIEEHFENIVDLIK